MERRRVGRKERLEGVQQCYGGEAGGKTRLESLALDNDKSVRKTRRVTVVMKEGRREGRQGEFERVKQCYGYEEGKTTLQSHAEKCIYRDVTQSKGSHEGGKEEVETRFDL